MSLSYVGSWHALIGTSYGLMLLAKIAMLAAMLALGGINFLMLRKYSPGRDAFRGCGGWWRRRSVSASPSCWPPRP